MAIEAQGREVEALFWPDGRLHELEITVTEAEVPPSFVEAVPVQFARSHNLVGVGEENGSVRVATCNPFDFHPLDELALMTGKTVSLVLAPKSEITSLINKAYQTKVDVVDEMLDELADDLDDDGDLDLYVSNMFSSAGRRIVMQEELVRLARISHPRVVVDTAGLSPRATELANQLAHRIRELPEERVEAMLRLLTPGA